MIALTIGTWAPLHRSPLQQLTSHLVIFAEGANFLQFFSLHLDEVVHPLAKSSSATPEVSALISNLTQRSSLSEQDTLVAFQGITWKKKQKYHEPVPKEG